MSDRSLYLMKKVKDYFAVVVIAVIFPLVLAGCNLRIGHIGNSSVKKTNASFMLLSETKKKSIKAEKGDIITFEYNIKLEKGTLSARLEDSTGDEIISFEPNTSGTKSVNIEEDDTYQLIIKADKAKGSYNFEWDIE